MGHIRSPRHALRGVRINIFAAAQHELFFRGRKGAGDIHAMGDVFIYKRVDNLSHCVFFGRLRRLVDNNAPWTELALFDCIGGGQVASIKRMGHESLQQHA